MCELCLSSLCSKFYKLIKQLLYIFPKDYADKDGHPFWIGPKWKPDPDELDVNDPLHLYFITACANLVSLNTGVPKDKDGIAKIESIIKLTVFSPRTGVKIQFEEKLEWEDHKGKKYSCNRSWKM